MKLLFSTDHSAAGLIVRTATFSHWSHVDIVMNNGWLIGALTEGVTLYRVEERIEKAADWLVREIEVEDEERVKAFLVAQIGRPYDWRGIFGLEFKRDWQKDDAWFCSELAAAAALYGGAKGIPEEAFRITPGALERICK